MIEIRPEDELLFCCARTKTSEEVGDRIKVLVRQNLDWHYLMKSAFHHKVVPLLYQNIRRISPSKIPKQCLNELQKYYEFNAKKNLFLAVELIKLLGLLEEKKSLQYHIKGLP